MLTPTRFTVVYNVINSSKRNATSRTCYKQAPKTVKSKIDAHLWFLDHVKARGRSAKRLVEIRES